MGIFSRTRDIIAANVTDLLDKAEDPAKMIRMIIMEMEETLVEVRASAARTIADQKEMRRQIAKLDRLQESWVEKAELALSKDREDLAKAALFEKQKAADMADQLKAEIERARRRAARLRGRHRQAAEQAARGPRPPERDHDPDGERAEPRAGSASFMPGPKVDDAFSRFDVLERHADLAEGQADALSLGAPPKTLDEEIAELRNADKVDAELEALKASTRQAHQRRRSQEAGGMSHGRHVIPIIVIVAICSSACPWMIFHYITKWKTAATLTTEDENLLDELHDLARRLDDRMCTIERIIQAENPNWRALGRDPVETALEDRTERMLRGRRPHQPPDAGGTDDARPAPNSISTSRTANGPASAPGSPIIPASTSPWSGSASCSARSSPAASLLARLFHHRLDGAEEAGRALRAEHATQKKFWQGVRANPRRTARDVRSRFRDLDRRLADVETYVTSSNNRLAREIEQLR